MALAWGAWPRGTYGDKPKELRWEHKEDYIMMVADGYALQGDLEESVRRLDFLGLDNSSQAIRTLIEAQPEGAESLVQLADALGMGGLLGTTHPPTASPTYVALYHLAEAIDLGCRRSSEDLIMIYLQDEEGKGLPGVEVKVWGSQGEDGFFTGLKPERGLGYADYAAPSPGEYRVEIAGGVNEATEIRMEPCPPAQGSHRLWRVIFQRKEE